MANNGPFIWDFSGLIDSPGLFARPGASCTQAQNIRIPYRGLAEKRNGFYRAGQPLNGPAWAVFTSRLLGEMLCSHQGTQSTGLNLYKGTGSGSTTALVNCDGQPVTRASNPRLHMAAAETAHYFTSEEGVRRVESEFTQVRSAGMPRGMPPDTFNMNPSAVNATGLQSGAVTGTLTGVAGAVYTDAGQSWTANDLRHFYITMTSGAAVGLSALISSNTTTAVTAATALTIAPAPGDTYAIQEVFTVLNTQFPGPLADGAAVAYRVTWHRKAQDGKTILGGAPTGRVVIRNIASTSGYNGPSAGVRCFVPIPAEYGSPWGFDTGGISPYPAVLPKPSPAVGDWPTQATAGQLTTDYFFRLWRSKIVTTGTPNDEMYLVQEQYITAADIARGHAFFYDITPDSYLQGQSVLNTNAVNFGGENELGLLQGVVNGDTAPPAATDAAYWATAAWYGNTTSRAQQLIQLLGYGQKSFGVGDAINVEGSDDPADSTYTGIAAVAPPGIEGPWPAALNQYDFVVTTGLATVALNIEATMRNFCEQYNRAKRILPVYAYYVSLGTETPGQVFFEMHSFNFYDINGVLKDEFTIQATDGRSFKPPLSEPITVDGEVQTNAIYFSKAGRPDSVPEVNFFLVGPSDSRILRVFGFRDRLYIFTDAGLYQITGDNFSNFAIQLVDETAKLFSPESVAIVEDAVYAWLVNGIARINESGVKIISDNIEATIRSILTDDSEIYMRDYSFAVGYRKAHRVQFFYPNKAEGQNGPFCSYWLEYNVREQVWTTGRFNPVESPLTYQGKACGVVKFTNDRLYLANWNSNGADGYFFYESSSESPIWFDYSKDNTQVQIEDILALQIQVPDTEGAVHWQQAVLQFNFGGPLNRPLPQFMNIYFSEYGTIGASPGPGSVTIDSVVKRFETPDTIRLGSRMAIILNGTALAAYWSYWGVTGIQMTFTPGTRFPVALGDIL